MEIQLVNFEWAKTLKVLGFPQETFFVYDLRSKNITSNINYFIIYGKDDHYVSAPTLELVAKWLRSEKNILVLPYLIGFVGIANESTPPELKTNIFGCQIVYYDIYKEGNEFLTLEEFVTYEEALSAGIDKALGILKGI